MCIKKYIPPADSFRKISWHSLKVESASFVTTYFIDNKQLMFMMQIHTLSRQKNLFQVP